MKAFAFFLGVSVVEATKLSSYAQGAEFDKCISLTDFETKTLDDDITLQDRDSGGCCPAGTVPGEKWYHESGGNFVTGAYQGAQVVCGFKPDGTVSSLTATTSNNAKTCTYNKCYVHKQNLGCTGSTDTKQKLNGCCGKWNKRTFITGCSSKWAWRNNVHSEKVYTCLSYHRPGSAAAGKGGTEDRTDDQKDGKLVVDKLYSYLPCQGSIGQGAEAYYGYPSTTTTTTTTTTVVKLSSYSQGAEFDKCIAITDFQTKTLDDDITLKDRESGGCCPIGTVPGQKWRTDYQGAQVVCGFKTDGSVALSTSSSNNAKTCTYNKCYVHKQNLGCTGDTHTKQKLNGCCGVAEPLTFKEDCKSYYYSFNNVHNEHTKYCLTYHKNYGTHGFSGTAEKTDDQKDGKLVVDKLKTYALCLGSTGAGGIAGSDIPTTADFSVRSTTGIVMMLATLVMLIH